MHNDDIVTLLDFMFSSTLTSQIRVQLTTEEVLALSADRDNLTGPVFSPGVFSYDSCEGLILRSQLSQWEPRFESKIIRLQARELYGC